MTLLRQQCNASWGFIIRDHDADVISTGRGRLGYALSAFQAELVACLQGVQAAMSLGIGKLIMETDALMVKQALSSNDYNASRKED